LGAAYPPVNAVTQDRLKEKIARRIRAEGPLSVAAYMAMALYDPEDGYYATRRPIGAGGDFITAPEISQIFGELIGVWCALTWQAMGRPDPVILAELGPGSGVLAADLLRAADALPGFRRALHLHLVEVSPILRAEQQRRLGMTDAIWLTRLEELPEGPLLVVANEFLDALPIRQLVRGPHGWAERMVTLDWEDRLVFADGPQNPAMSLLVPPSLRHSALPGAVFEICPAALNLATTLGARLGRNSGAALFIDYGRTASDIGGSLRAVSGHSPADPLAAPGDADLSDDVDFAAFAEAARVNGIDIYGPVPQGRFLRALGAEARLAALCARASPEQQARLQSGLNRLLEPEQMGDLFKVLAFASRGLPTPGFDNREPIG
jgi:NADH dehydrogenase [ubiquinone] 1 alpha subcomplex assembly factor 7